MKRLNVTEIETRWGYRAFELYQGDITRLEPPTDLMAVSVLAGDYNPLNGTVVGALHERFGISLPDLLADCEFDLRHAFGCWVSREIQNPTFRRLLCVEIIGRDLGLEVMIENVFVIISILEAKGIRIQDFALPMLGTGSLGLDRSLIIGLLLKHGLNHLRRSPTLRRIRFVGHSPSGAAELDNAMNKSLERARIVVPKGKVVDEARDRILDRLEQAEPLFGSDGLSLLVEVRKAVTEDTRSFELGMTARRLVEFIANDVLGSHNKSGLFARLEAVRKSSDPRVAEWVVMYMHVLRVMGNEAAHQIGKQGTVPPIVNESDLELCLLCICRLLETWVSFREHSLGE